MNVTERPWMGWSELLFSNLKKYYKGYKRNTMLNGIESTSKDRERKEKEKGLIYFGKTIISKVYVQFEKSMQENSSYDVLFTNYQNFSGRR